MLAAAAIIGSCGATSIDHEMNKREKEIAGANGGESESVPGTRGEPRAGAVTNGRECRLDRIRRAKMLPVNGRKLLDLGQSTVPDETTIWRFRHKSTRGLRTACGPLRRRLKRLQ